VDALTGFGENLPWYSYSDPYREKAALRQKIHRLGPQAVRIFVPLAVVQTGLLGKIGVDHPARNLERLQRELHAGKAGAAYRPGFWRHLKKVGRAYANANAQYNQDHLYVESFLDTLSLVDKQTTINLTFCAAIGLPPHVESQYVESAARLVRYLLYLGYSNLQVTLENEPNGPDKGHGFRGTIDKDLNAHDVAGAKAEARKYVEAYQELSNDLESTAHGGLPDLVHGNVRDQVALVAGDLVHNNCTPFLAMIGHGLRNIADAYSFHIYWHAAHGKHPSGLANALRRLAQIKKIDEAYGGGKPMQITEFGEKLANGDASEQGVHPAFDQGLFALTAIGDGFTTVDKWDAFYGGPHHAGDHKGDQGAFSMIAGPSNHYAVDDTYRLMSMFSQAIQPGWTVTYAKPRGVAGVEVHFLSPDGTHGAILAMSRAGGPVSTASLPAGATLNVATWTPEHNRAFVSTETLPPGTSTFHVPKGGAVAISTQL
jgi:hypothetical protein